MFGEDLTRGEKDGQINKRIAGEGLLGFGGRGHIWRVIRISFIRRHLAQFTGNICSSTAFEYKRKDKEVNGKGEYSTAEALRVRQAGNVGEDDKSKRSLVILAGNLAFFD